jgi:hypothetical protein
MIGRIRGSLLMENNKMVVAQIATYQGVLMTFSPSPLARTAGCVHLDRFRHIREGNGTWEEMDHLAKGCYRCVRLMRASITLQPKKAKS